eukprot:g32408.t1
MFYETSNKKDELIAHTAFIVGTTSCGKSGAVRQKFLVLSQSGYQLFWEKVSQLQSQNSTNITLGCMGSCPLRPFRLIWRSEPHSLSGKLLPDAQTYPDWPTFSNRTTQMRICYHFQ